MMTHDQKPPATDEIPMGLVWEGGEPADAPEAPRPDDYEAREAPPEAARGTVVPAPEAGEAASPKRALLEDVNARLQAAFAAWHTYAMIAWARRWQTAEAYIQDPQLYEEIAEEARAEIWRQRAAAAKKLDKARIRKDEAQVKLLSEELALLERRAPSAMKMDALTLKARGGRLARQAAVPAAVAFGPLVALFGAGMWWPLLAYPVAWGWLAVQGHAIAVAEGSTAVTETPAQAPVLAAPQGGASPASPPAPGAPVVGASEAENRILGCIAEWAKRASGRGLAGVAPASPTIDALGIRVVLTTTGRITPEALGKKIDAIRAALSVPTGVRTDLSPGEVGDQAVLRIRTRTPERDMTWRPDRQGIGVDTDTGAPVVLPKGRMLIAGTSGAGKSVLLRVVMAEALCADEPTVVVYLDGKGEESALWKGKVRIANTPHEILSVLADLGRESAARSQAMQEQGVATWVPTEERPRIVVVVDEGAEIVSMDNPDEEIDLIKRLRPLATMGRSRGIDLKWATQKPTVGEGIPSQLAGVMQDRLALKTAGRKENNLVLGPDWSSHELELGGFALANVHGRGPGQAPIQVWDLSDDSAVLGLPEAQPWRHVPRGGAPEAPREAGKEADGIPPVLAAALALLEMDPDANGLQGQDVARACDMDLLAAQEALREAGVKGDRYYQNGTRVRGYPRSALEEAASRYES
ncbi:hypothetical protein RM446_12165 [Streptomonospora sp. DSM 45055]|uniref:FtsK domain-containing protein n=2 Tax=Streptomonospora wellingtoniae TaxID=3075544 RepID=A0ABU2KUD5_9ACTN|nr:hypothetical protein [Streptomonospora sp. DSM 45055]